VIDVAFTPEELAGTDLGRVAAVMIDTVRASTTIVTALAHGARAILPVATPAAARAAAARGVNGPVLLGGERGGAPPAGFALGNSPAEYAGPHIAGRTVVFTTTNGTRALLALAKARAVAVGGYVNAEAVSRWAARQGGCVVFVCAGELGRFSLEDAACAGLLVNRLRARRPEAPLTDGARAAALLHAAYADHLDRMLADATWARALDAQGRGADLPLCVAVDAYQAVPVWRDGRLVAGGVD
jgi:2-phosphosulfolactate phosphatase